MNFIYFLTYLTLPILVSSKKSRHSDSESEEISSEERGSKHETSHLDFTGSLRQSFALEAIQLQGVQNLVCSPVSALMPLGKLALGADGRSESELLDSIGVERKSKIKRKFKKLINDMKHLPGVNLHLASKIFVSDQAHVNKDFARLAKKIFKSAVEKINFDNHDKASRKINKWIEEESGYSKIASKKINIPISKQSAIMVNVVRFSGDWAKKFHRVAAKEFHTLSGVINVPMMTHTGHYNYVKSDVLSAQIIEIPYEKGRASLVVVLPYSKSGLSVMLKQLKLAPELLNHALNKMSPESVILSLPKFRIETSLDLKEVYRKVGLHHVFSSHSGLTGILKDEELSIGWAEQFCIIDVNEKGTDAAAITVVNNVQVKKILNQVVFNADHPFLFYVKSMNEQLFAGVFAGY